MKLLLTLLGFWLPLGSIVTAITVAVIDATSAFPGLADATLIISCGGVVWAAASIKTGVAKDLAAIREQLDTMVTRDAMELRLSQERNVSDTRYVTQGDCDQVHQKLNGRMNGYGNGGNGK